MRNRRRSETKRVCQTLKHRPVRFVVASICVLAGLPAGASARQTPGLILGDTIVAVGSRGQPRSVTESTVPVDVVTTEEFSSQGATELADRLRTLIPSFNVASHPISDAATIVRPVSLRNLAHDHTLVLVNGKRRHRSSVITWYGGATDGSQGPDLSSIPSIALRQIEILRDGASAQYGSDAIAGVLNFLPKDARSGGSVEFNTGLYHEGDGEGYTFAGNAGLPLGGGGFANLSLEYGNTNPTDRSVQRDDAAALIAAGNTDVRDPAQEWGSPRVEDDLKLFGNFGYLFDNGLDLYGHTNYASKTVTGGFFFRNPTNRATIYSLDGGATLLVADVLQAGGQGSANCPTVRITDLVPDPVALARVHADPDCFAFTEIAPGGFTPQFGADATDMSVAGGLRRTSGSGFTWDASASFGAHQADFFLLNTVNASLGPDTPRDFRPGLDRQEEINLSLDVSYPITGMIHLAAGAEWRDERFEIGIGGKPSWEAGPYSAQGFVSGSNGFPGFGPNAQGSWNRSNLAAYGDVELRDPGEGSRWTLGTAVRVENFDLFGTTTNGKLSGRYQLHDAISLRSSLSTGFRAPTPGQQHAFNVQTTLDPNTLQLVDSGTVPSISRAAELRGGQPLEPETSISTTVGAVVNTGFFVFTADYFRVAVHDRLSLSTDFQLTAPERATLVADGIVSASTLTSFRFFLNDFSTLTQGVDLIATWTPLALEGNTSLSLAFNHTTTSVTRVDSSDRVGPVETLSIERSVPETRWVASAEQRVGPARLLGRLNYYGPWLDVFDVRFIRGVDAQVFSGRYLVDLELALSISDDLSLMAGTRNRLNTFSDKNEVTAGIFGLPYSQFTPWGFDGGYYHARLSYSFGP